MHSENMWIDHEPEVGSTVFLYSTDAPDTEEGDGSIGVYTIGVKSSVPEERITAIREALIRAITTAALTSDGA